MMLLPMPRWRGWPHCRDLEAGHSTKVAAVTGTNSTSIGFHQKPDCGPVNGMSQDRWKFDQFRDLVLMQKFL